MRSSTLNCSFAEPFVKLLNKDGLNVVAVVLDCSVVTEGDNKFKASARTTFSGCVFFDLLESNLLMALTADVATCGRLGLEYIDACGCSDVDMLMYVL